jgi:hypothetical protein
VAKKFQCFEVDLKPKFRVSGTIWVSTHSARRDKADSEGLQAYAHNANPKECDEGGILGRVEQRCKEGQRVDCGKVTL